MNANEMFRMIASWRDADGRIDVSKVDNNKIMGMTPFEAVQFGIIVAHNTPANDSTAIFSRMDSGVKSKFSIRGITNPFGGVGMMADGPITAFDSIMVVYGLVMAIENLPDEKVVSKEQRVLITDIKNRVTEFMKTVGIDPDSTTGVIVWKEMPANKRF